RTQDLYTSAAEKRGYPMSTKEATSQCASALRIRPRLLRPFLLPLLWLLPFGVLADDGLVTTQSAHSGPATVQRIQEALTATAWTIPATIDHAAHAVQWGVKIPFRTTIDFAYLPAWTRLLLENPTVAIEVPIPVLVWEDRDGVWVTRNTAQYYL